MFHPSVKQRESDHYLGLELADRIKNDPGMWTFLQQGALDGVWYWDLERPDQEYMSAEFWKLLGVDPATKPHDPEAWQDIIFPEDLETALENFNAHCADPDHPYDQIVRYLHSDGSTVWVRCRGLALRNAEGTPIRMLGTHTDVTALKTAEETAVIRRAKLEMANRELESFVYGVSHDLKSPSRTALNLIREGLQDGAGQLTEDQHFLFNGACEMLERMQLLIDDLLGYGRVVNQKMVWEEVCLAGIVSDVLDDLRCFSDGAEIVIDIDEDLRFEGFSTQIRMLIQNLIQNALKYKRPEVVPRVQVTAEKTGMGLLEISVEDNGCGIPEHKFDAIFDAFSRLHRQDAIPGTGVGLCICKRVAVNHAGEIRVSSTLGEGSRFSFTVPIRRRPHD
jgi:signal transduction histidine kinase